MKIAGIQTYQVPNSLFARLLEAHHIPKNGQCFISDKGVRFIDMQHLTHPDFSLGHMIRDYVDTKMEAIDSPSTFSTFLGRVPQKYMVLPYETDFGDYVEEKIPVVFHLRHHFPVSSYDYVPGEEKFYRLKVSMDTRIFLTYDKIEKMLRYSPPNVELDHIRETMEAYLGIQIYRKGHPLHERFPYGVLVFPKQYNILYQAFTEKKPFPTFRL